MRKESLTYYFKEYYALIFRIAFSEVKNHADADDILQEVYLRLLRYEPDFQGKEHEKAWMIRTTINLCKDFMKNKWNQSMVGLERYRQPLYLFYYEDYSILEIAEILDMQPNTVKTNLKRGREKIKAMLEQT